MKKQAEFAGADSKTPSIPQYFSWINNTNEGSTEKQTLVNLEFFKYMKEKYGMQIRIYAWDAGNFDGASEGYGNLNGEKFKSQYPEGYKNVVKKADELGIRFGLWGSPDGYGKTDEEQKERFDFFVHLCKDYHFAEFKLDGVCGNLREEKAGVFADMLKECRKYSPDLIVLNHRLNLYEAEKYVTTFLWNGEETYTDVFTHNQKTGMHNRVYMFNRGHVENLERLAEDHGVCLSSSLDYFEDELIYQAFSRSLILAPEMYGNPWFLRDEELPLLANVYNLQAKYADLLVDGMLLDEKYGCNAVSRGTGTHRIICTGNDTWETKRISVTLDESIGIEKCGKYVVNMLHPYEYRAGVFNFGEKTEIELLPFRAMLIEIVSENEAEILPEFCGEKEGVPVFLGTLTETVNNPENGEKYYEASVFAADNDSLEARCIKRSGETKIPQVKNARDEFFSQKTYKLRGCEAKNMFDGSPDSFFDSQSKTYMGGFRIKGGCLRIDAGEITDADCVEIEFFAPFKQTNEVRSQFIPTVAEFSTDYENWKTSILSKTEVTVPDYCAEIVKFKVHTTYFLKGVKMKAVYPINGKIRFLRIAQPTDRIYSVKFIKNSTEVKLHSPHANNLQAHYSQCKTAVLKQGEFILPKYKSGSYIAVAVEGIHGAECVYCCAEINGSLVGFPRRAPDYKANVWEHIVCNEEKNNTFFLPLSENIDGEKIKIFVSLSDRNKSEVECNVYLCEKHI